MKKLSLVSIAIILISIIACSNRVDQSGKDHDMSKMNHTDSMSNMNNMDSMRNMSNDTTRHPVPMEGKEVKDVAVMFTDLDTRVAASVKGIVDHYLRIKNALASDNGNDAASAAHSMEEDISKLDKSLLSSKQKKVYDAIEDDLKGNAEHIGKNAGNINHQREHFSMMSEDIYDLVKAFGGGRTLYHDHCPMYNEGKGAIWISEMKEVKNPYFGAKMPTCGSVEEVIK